MWRYVDSTLGWGGVGWDINVLATTSLILCCHRMFHQLGKEVGKLCKEQKCGRTWESFASQWRAWMWKMTLTPPPTGRPTRRDLVYQRVMDMGHLTWNHGFHYTYSLSQGISSSLSIPLFLLLRENKTRPLIHKLKASMPAADTAADTGS